EIVGVPGHLRHRATLLYDAWQVCWRCVGLPGWTSGSDPTGPACNVWRSLFRRRGSLSPGSTMFRSAVLFAPFIILRLVAEAAPKWKMHVRQTTVSRLPQISSANLAIRRQTGHCPNLMGKRTNHIS